MDEDPYALEGWESFVRDVAAIGLLSTTDGHAAALYAALHSEERHLTEDIDDRGYMVPAAHGDGKVVNSAVAARDRARNRKLSILTEYGLTASARSRLRASEQTEVDEFDQYMKARG